jgi:hypothetical protein
VAGLYAQFRRRRLQSALSGLVSSSLPKSGAFPPCGRRWSAALGLSSQIHILSGLPPSHKGRAIRELQEALTDLAQASGDENILATLWMASAEIVPEDRYQAPKSAFNPPLPGDQWIDAWASVSSTEHSNMIRELIKMRGGLGNIRLFDLAKALLV